MRNDTRQMFDSFIARQAELNHVSVDAVVKKFTAEPSIQQTLESKVQESSAFLKTTNWHGVDEQEGEKIGLGVTGTIASRTDTTSTERKTKDISSTDSQKYRCEQTNYDTHIRYAKLDQWAKFKDFQLRLSNAIIEMIALNRIMIGFNGTSCAATSNPTANPLLQDVNIGWLQKIRAHAPQRHMFETVEGSNVLNVGSGAEYKNIDALVYDMVNNLIDPWFQDDTKLVAICGRKLLADKYFPIVNANHKPTDQLASDMIISQKRIGNLPAVRVPHFPPNGVLVTRLDNLSFYYQNGTQRRSIVDNAQRDRIETYQSSNDAFIIEEYGCAAFAENIVISQ